MVEFYKQFRGLLVPASQMLKLDCRLIVEQLLRVGKS
jgi:hypothetical protein